MLPGSQRPASVSRSRHALTNFSVSTMCISVTSTMASAAERSGKPCRSPAKKKGRCRLHGGASGRGAPPGERNGQYRHGERTKAAIAEQQKFRALLKMLRADLT